MSSHYRIPPEKSSSAYNLPVKIRPARAAAGRGGIFAGKLSAGGDFSGEEGDPLMGHQHASTGSTDIMPAAHRMFYRSSYC